MCGRLQHTRHQDEKKFCGQRKQTSKSSIVQGALQTQSVYMEVHGVLDLSHVKGHFCKDILLVFAIHYIPLDLRFIVWSRNRNTFSFSYLYLI